MVSAAGWERPARAAALAAALTVVLLWVAWLVCSTLGTVHYQKGADEYFYLSYAVRVAEEGPGAFPGLLRAYLANPESARYFPSPLRLGTVLLGAAAVRLGGIHFGSLSLGAFLLLLALVFIATRRSFGERTALWTLLLLSASPLHLALSRRALSDTLTSLSLTVCLWLFAWALWAEGRPSSRRWWTVALAYAAAVLVKESSLLLLVPVSLVFLGWQAVRRRQLAAFGWPVCAVSVVPLAISGLAMGLAAADPGLVWETLKVFGSGAPANLYAQRYQEGPWFRFVVDFMLLSPWATLLYLVGLGWIFSERPRDERVWFWAFLPILFVGLASWFPSGKNIRFALFLDVPIRLCVVWILQRLTGDAEGAPAGRTAAMALAVAALMAVDLNSYYRLFVWGGIYDPVSASLLENLRFIPAPH